MANPYFQFKQFTVYQDRCAMKVTTDSCFFGAWAAREMMQYAHSEREKIENVLDIGTGTGLISLLIAQKNAGAIDAVEIDSEAAEQAAENAKDSPWKDRIKIFNEDILSFQPESQYDCIICNPPFYENDLASSKEKRNLAHHSGQLTIAQVVNSIAVHLKKGGMFFLMYPFKRKEEVGLMLEQHHLNIVNSIILQQSVNHAPFRVIVMGTNKEPDAKNSKVVSIWNEHQQYTKAFIHVLEDYYLHL